MITFLVLGDVGAHALTKLQIYTYITFPKTLFLKLLICNNFVFLIFIITIIYTIIDSYVFNKLYNCIF